MNKRQRIVSILLLICTLISLLPMQSVYASTANITSAKMINFFQTGNDVSMGEISEGELLVYGVFLSNFFTPGETQVKDLKGETDKGKTLASNIADVFLQDNSKSSKVLELHKLVHDASLISLSKLTDVKGNGVTGDSLLRGMGQARAGVSKNETDLTKVYLNGTTVIDFKEDAFRGAFKILGAQSAKYVFDSDYGIGSMKSFYIDCFGNIWGAYTQEVGSNNFTEEGETSSSDLHLVLPACLNPLSFHNTSTGGNLNKLRVPLNNSFAMGSLIQSSDIGDEVSSKPMLPYYNVPTYFKDDKYNVLYIYGVNSATPWFGATDKISDSVVGSNESQLVKIAEDTKKSIDNFYNNGFKKAENYSLVFANRLNIVEKDLVAGKNFWTGNGSERVDIIRYLYDTLIVDIEKTNSTLYYFGESQDSWAETDFAAKGMTGINMFGYKDADSWIIHDNNQKAPLLTTLYSENRGITNIEDLNELIGVDKKTVYLTPDNSVKGKIDNAGILANFLTFGTAGNYVFIQGLSTQHDTEVYNNLITGFNKGFKDDRQIFALYNTLNNYTISGAQFKGDKIQENFTIQKNEAEQTTLTTTNKRVGTRANWPGVFWGYMVEMFDMKDMITYDENGKPFYDVRDFESIFLPELPDGIVSGGGLNLTPLDSESGVSNSENLTFEEIQKDLIKKIYGIISDEPNEYRDSWLKATLDGFIISTHKAITGSWIANIATVSSENESSYNSVVGYIHTPSLHDLPFTSWFMNNYMQIYILCLLIVMIFIIFMVLLNMRTWREGLMLFLLMTFCLILPNVLIENTINFSNSAADEIYSDRFDFWAITQHQQSIKRLKGAVDTGNLEYYIQQNDENARNVYSKEAGVRVKWMSPKKTSVFNSMFTNDNMSDKLATNLTIFKWLFSSFVYQQEFVSSDPFATYLYRPYNSIASDADEFYKLAVNTIAEKNKDRVSYDMEFVNRNNDKETYNINVPSNIIRIYDNLNTDYSEKYRAAFYGSAVWGDKTLLNTEDNVFNIYWSIPKYEDITERASQYMGSSTDDLKRLRSSVSLWGLGNKKVTEIITQNGSLIDSSGPDILLLDDKPDSTDSETIELLGFYKHTESPYYYFYNTLKYRYSDGNDNGFKNALLKRDTFVVTDSKLESTNKSPANALRDFLDLEGLFTNVVPYMTMSNDFVYGWTSVHGTSVPDYDFSRTGDDSAANSTYTDLKQLKNGMQKVWSMYSPWVDQLNSLDVHNEKIGIASKRLTIENTLNPSYYLKAGRPMIFSEADMIAKGYTQKELSDVERRVQRVLETTYNDLQYLVNYYDMDNEVLITVASMYATFNFNREFSQKNVIGESVMMYPQGFEMKNFNYDAFMRLVMLNSTGESIFAENVDLYNRILSKTSFFTGLMLLVTDVLGVIIIPTMKIIILLLLLFLGLLLCLSCVISPPYKFIESIFKSLMLPALLFLVANVIFAFVISLLVGDGLSSYVGSKNIAITTNDPTITIGIMIIVNAVYCISLFKIIKILFDNSKSFGLSTLQVGGSILAGAALSGLKQVTKGTQTVGGAVGGAAVGSAMAGKGNRFKGALDGVSIGSKGGSVFQERRREQRLSDAMSGKSITDEINEKASGNGKIETSIGETRNTTQDNISATELETGKQNLKETFKKGLEDRGYTKGNTINKVTGSVLDRAKQTSSNIKDWQQDHTVLGTAIGGVAVAGQKMSSAGLIAKENISKGLRDVQVGVGVGSYQVKEGIKSVKTNVDRVGNYVSSGSIVTDAKDATTKGLKYAGQGVRAAGTTTINSAKSVGRKVSTGAIKTYDNTTQYVEKSIKQASAMKDLAKQSKIDTVNPVYESNRGYNYETKLKSEGKLEVDRKDRREAQREVNKKDNKNLNRVNKEVKSRIQDIVKK